MNRIYSELKLSKEYYLDFYEGTQKRLPKLSKDNVARVEAMIHFNSSYRGKFVDYCKELKTVLVDKRIITADEYKTLLENLVITIDSENSTHLNSDGVGRDEIVRRLLGIGKTDLLEYLRNPATTDYKLFRLIEAETKAEGISKKGNVRKNRTNTSFASKFCHYTCFYLFENKKEQDNYSIYDSIVRKTLPEYAEYFDIDIKKSNLKDYIYYQRVIDMIIEKSDSKISRNGFDHLIWYCNK